MSSLTFYTLQARLLPRIYLTQVPTTRHASSSSTARLQRISRGGQNLSDRYSRLERSIREKVSLSDDIQELIQPGVENTQLQGSQPKTKKDVITFKGLVVPEEPKAPEADECCMSGCAICVYDLYEDSMQAYKDSVAKLRSSLTDMHVPESEWPLSVRSASDKSKQGRRANEVSMSAFEAMERALKVKQGVDTGGPVQQSTHKARPPKEPLRRTMASDVRESYEGIRWIIFSNR